MDDTMVDCIKKHKSFYRIAPVLASIICLSSTPGLSLLEIDAHDSHIEQLISSAKNEFDPNIRYELALEIGKYIKNANTNYVPSPETIDMISSLLKSDDLILQFGAALALHNFGEKANRAVPVMLDVYQSLICQEERSPVQFGPNVAIVLKDAIFNLTKAKPSSTCE